MSTNQQSPVQPYEHGQSGPYGPVNPSAPFPQGPAPKKSHKLRNGLIGGGVLLVLAAGCNGVMNGGSTDNAAQAGSAPSVTKTTDAPAAKPGKTEAAKPVSKPKPAPKLSVARQQAVRAAESYLESMPFSKKGLIKQLKFDKHSTADATYAAEHVKVSWNEQAAKAAQSYLDTMPFSHGDLVKQLKFDGYTAEQAAHGVKSVGL